VEYEKYEKKMRIGRKEQAEKERIKRQVYQKRNDKGRIALGRLHVSTAHITITPRSLFLLAWL
jgi:hypothetical protein